MAVTEIGRIDTMTLVERKRLNDVLEEQRMSLSGLTDTSAAIQSVAQVLFPTGRDIQQLLGIM
ncbi:MAG: hypothetical protein SVR04_15825 [Spirochaetota bacterium]|nr:hypothetical protein [Spirochaetota bacterium]